jgi:hypothetical protein
LGASPQTPRVGFAEFWVATDFHEAEQRFLLLFLEKQEKHQINLTVSRLTFSELGIPVVRLYEMERLEIYI